MPNRPSFSPFDSFNQSQRKYLAVLSGLLLFIIMMVMTTIEAQLAENGIVPFELAGEYEQSQVIMQAWGAEGRMKAAFLIGIDFLYIPVYCFFIGFCCYALSSHFIAQKLKSLGRILSWLIIVAGLFDVVENIALYQLLRGSASFFWSKIALWCAIPKFGIVIMGILYALAGLITAGLHKLTKK